MTIKFSENDFIICDLCEKLSLKEPITKKYLANAIESATLFDKKQHDYGPDNIAQFGELGVLIRLNDKIQRLKTLMLSGEDPSVVNEAVEDTWMDIHVYGMIGLMCHIGQWPNTFKFKLSGTGNGKG